MSLDKDTIRLGLACKCPRCGKGDLYKTKFSLNLRDTCDSCGLDLSKNDSADGPAVFLMFILGFTIVPLAILLEMTLHPPLWVHAALWSVVLIGLTMGMLRQTKAYIIALQYKHRPGDWE